jgi:hypothetical protein
VFEEEGKTPFEAWMKLAEKNKDKDWAEVVINNNMIDEGMSIDIIR